MTLGLSVAASRLVEFSPDRVADAPGYEYFAASRLARSVSKDVGGFSVRISHQTM